jgi:hypothetical protein
MIALATKKIVMADSYCHEKIPGRSAKLTCVTVTQNPETVTRVDTGRNLNRNSLHAPDPAQAPAVGTGI